MTHDWSQNGPFAWRLGHLRGRGWHHGLACWSGARVRVPAVRSGMCLSRGGGGVNYETHPHGIWENPGIQNCPTPTGGRGGAGVGHRPTQNFQDTHPPHPCDIPSGCCSFTGPWTVTRPSLRMLPRVAAFCRPLRPVLLLVSFPRSRSPVVGVSGLCWMWHGVPFACQRRPIFGVLGVVLVVGGVV